VEDVCGFTDQDQVLLITQSKVAVRQVCLQELHIRKVAGQASGFVNLTLLFEVASVPVYADDLCEATFADQVVENV